jgi:hypothetical protein
MVELMETYKLLILWRSPPPWSSKLRAIAAARTCHPWGFTVRKTCKVVIMIERPCRDVQVVEQVTEPKVECLVYYLGRVNDDDAARLERHTCGLEAAAWEL